MSISIIPAASPAGPLPLPPRANALFRALSSAAVDAELARIARSWNIETMEARVCAFKSNAFTAATRRKTFRAQRHGSRLKPAHAARIQAAFPRSSVMLWWTHPLAEVLCNPSLGLDEIVALLRLLPIGKIDDLLWERLFVPATGYQAKRLRPWTGELIRGLSEIGSPTALFALISRMRVEQLLGNLELGLEAARAAWRLLPLALSRSRGLLVSLDGLVLAIDFFLSWQPFADSRLCEMAATGESLERRKALVECARLWDQDVAIPAEVKSLRRDIFGQIGSPCSDDEWSWWSAVFSPHGFGVERSSGGLAP